MTPTTYAALAATYLKRRIPMNSEQLLELWLRAKRTMV